MNFQSLAVNLYQQEVITLEKAAKLANQSVEAFIEKLGSLGIPVVDYSAKDLRKEPDSFD